MKSSLIQFALVAFAGLASAAPQGGVLGAITGVVGPRPIKPSDDPFYTPAAGFESAKPGAILRTRPVPNALSLLQTIPLQLQGAYQILYRTTDAMGNATATVTTILIPKNADFKKVVSYQVAEDSGGQINCAPSYGLQSGSDIEFSGTANIESALIAAALNQGWVVNTPDWEGPKSTFIDGIGAGQATLDSIRAALASGSFTNISPEAKVQMWGYR